MGCMDANERAELADMVAQAVIDRMEERSKVNMLVETVIQRILALQQQEVALCSQEQAATPFSSQENHDVEPKSQN